MTERIGETHKNKQGYNVTIISYNNNEDCDVIFDDKRKTILRNVNYETIKRGSISNPFHPTVLGVGYLGLQSSKMQNREYIRLKWKDMLKRCYTYKDKNKSYVSVFVCDEWLNLSNFINWVNDNYDFEKMKNWHLDKDILVKGNKIYAPEFCCFVPQEINVLFTKSNCNRGVNPIGVFKTKNKYYSHLNGKFISYHNNVEDAFNSYKTYKEKWIKEVADKWKYKINPKVYEALYNYQVEITD